MLSLSLFLHYGVENDGCHLIGLIVYCGHLEIRFMFSNCFSPFTFIGSFFFTASSSELWSGAIMFSVAWSYNLSLAGSPSPLMPFLTFSLFALVFCYIFFFLFFFFLFFVSFFLCLVFLFVLTLIFALFVMIKLGIYRVISVSLCVNDWFLMLVFLYFKYCT